MRKTEDVLAIERVMKETLELAESYGMVVTVKTVPLWPPAMGHYKMELDVREARSVYGPKMAEARRAKEAGEPYDPAYL